MRISDSPFGGARSDGLATSDDGSGVAAESGSASSSTVFFAFFALGSSSPPPSVSPSSPPLLPLPLPLPLLSEDSSEDSPPDAASSLASASDSEPEPDASDAPPATSLSASPSLPASAAASLSASSFAAAMASSAASYPPSSAGSGFAFLPFAAFLPRKSFCICFSRPAASLGLFSIARIKCAATLSTATAPHSQPWTSTMPEQQAEGDDAAAAAVVSVAVATGRCATVPSAVSIGCVVRVVTVCVAMWVGMGNAIGATESAPGNAPGNPATTCERILARPGIFGSTWPATAPPAVAHLRARRSFSSSSSRSSRSLRSVTRRAGSTGCSAGSAAGARAGAVPGRPSCRDVAACPAARCRVAARAAKRMEHAGIRRAWTLAPPPPPPHVAGVATGWMESSGRLPQKGTRRKLRQLWRAATKA